jgi:Homeobox KN domain
LQAADSQQAITGTPGNISSAIAFATMSMNSSASFISKDSTESTLNIVSPSRPRLASLSSMSKSSSPMNKRKSTSLPSTTVEYLKAWMMSPAHIAHPYPTDQEKAKIMADTGIELKQLTNWFVNNRKRYWKPRVEAQVQVQTKPQGAPTTATTTASLPVVAVSPVPPVLAKVVSTGNVSSMVDSVEVESKKVQLMRRASVEISKMPLTSDIFHLNSPARSVSEQSSFASESNSDLSSTDEEEEEDEEEVEASVIMQTEMVTLHILRPFNAYEQPTLEDVTILSNVPTERIMCSYESCMLTYRFPSDADKKKVSLVGWMDE